MTRDEAIKILKKKRDFSYIGWEFDALDKAIQDL